LIEPCTLAGGPEGGTVLDPFLGAGTTALVADRLGDHCLGIELSPVMRSSRAAGSAVRPSPRPRSGGKGFF